MAEISTQQKDGDLLNKGIRRTPKPPLHAGAEIWGTAQAAHLFMRAAFGGTQAEIGMLGSLPREEALNLLLADAPLPPPPGAWVSEPYITEGLTQEQLMELQRLNRERIDQLINWWVELMRGALYNLREKMALFWHGHFATEADVVNLAQWLFIHTDMLRRNTLGNFRTFLKEMWKDPAILIYLDGNQNNRIHPNENFARELLELFTMGVGNYTEQDIKEAARAFTGWRVDRTTLTSYFVPNRYDSSVKTFLGQSGNFDGDAIIDIILQQSVTATFICHKLYQFFVSPEVDDTRVTALADIFRNNDYEIKPVLRAMFESDYFYDENSVGVIIKSPVHLTISSVRQFAATTVDPTYMFVASRLLDQILLDPPNVAGWPGQRAWISPTTLALRGAYGETVIKGGNINRPNANPDRVKPIVVDAMAFARSFGVNKARELLDKWIEHLLPFGVDENSKEFLLSVLIETADENDWSLDYPGADVRVKNCLTQIVRLPEFQLT